VHRESGTTGSAAADWDGNVTNADAANCEVTVSSFPATGIVRIEIGKNDTPATIADRMAKEWNLRQPIENVVAVASPGQSLTGFFLQGPLADGKHAFVQMAVTFDAKTREISR